MENFIYINNKKIELTDKQVKKIRDSFCLPNMDGDTPDILLADVPVGDVVKIGKYEFVVLEHLGDTSAVILKDLLIDNRTFGKNNNYDGSYVDAECNKFADEVAAIVGEENLIRHTVDLTSDDGLKDYGKIKRYAPLLTADLYRRYVKVLDKHKVEKWWWLSTAYSTATHDNTSWVKCVTPSGGVYNNYYNFGLGVRPFCILKSNIFVSM